MKLFRPNFSKSNLNISATLAEFLHAPNRNATLPLLENELQKNYKKVVFICFDGMGNYPLEQNLAADSFLRRHIVDTLLSTFPATTTNATTSLLTNTLPLEHGWFGWSVHFPQDNKNVNIFLSTDSWTNEKLSALHSPLEHFPAYFDLAQTDYQVKTVFPPYVHTAHPENNFVFHGLDEFFRSLEACLQGEDKTFVYAYCSEPDYSMHEQGVTCPQTKLLLEKISDSLEAVTKKAQDTLFVVTADHGQIDVTDYIYFYRDEKFMSMLQIYPYLEPRAMGLKVKDGMHQQFEAYFNATYGDDYILFKSAELVAQGYFGERGDKAYLLGDYIAVETNGKQGVFAPEQMKFRGHHTSLTEEMRVPLILIGKK